MKKSNFVLDFLPLIIFFISYKYKDLIFATYALLLMTFISTAINLIINKKIAYLPLITLALVSIMALLTLYTGNTKFIKIKPTIINLFFASILLIGAFFRVGLLKHIFNEAINLDEMKWVIFSRRWGIFFLFLAVLNEIIWRNFPENIWVNFKVFGILALTVLFLISQLKFISQNHK